MDSGFRGLGRIPSVQTKTDEGKESKNLLRFFWIAFVMAEVIQIVFYVAMNSLFEGQDWYWLLYGLVAVSAGWFYWRTAQRWGAWYQFISDSDFSILWSWRSAILSVAYFIAVSDWAVPTIVRTFDFREGLGFWGTLSYMASSISVSLLISVLAAGGALLVRALSEMTDRYHSPVEVAVEREKRKTLIALERERWSIKREADELAQLPSETQVDDGSLPVLVRGAGRIQRVAPYALRLKVALIVFLEGLDSGEWETGRETWMGQDLGESGFRLTRGKGNEMRDFLINGGWAEWLDDSKKGGWRLKYDVPDIIDDLRMGRGPDGFESKVGEST